MPLSRLARIRLPAVPCKSGRTLWEPARGVQHAASGRRRGCRPPTCLDDRPVDAARAPRDPIRAPRSVTKPGMLRPPSPEDATLRPPRGRWVHDADPVCEDDLIPFEENGASATRDPVSAQRQMMESIMNPVVKVFCQHTEPNYSLPWQRQRQVGTSSSGFAVKWGDNQQWLLTNAHSVEYHSQVKVKRRGDDRKFIARVLAIGTECDLALLTVDEEEFWNELDAVPLGEMPGLQESVAVVGYPVGGDTISVTAGVVSRIEVTSYVHGSTQLLGVQIDAAINSGNSGGPAYGEDGQLVGIAFQSYAGSEVENVGWLIPVSVIRHFLEDFSRNATYTGFPVLGVQWQRMESKALRRHMLMEEHHKGVLVTHVSEASSATGVLRSGDVLLAFDGEPIACDGTVAFRTGERIFFSYLISRKFVGDCVEIRVLRKGQEMALTVMLQHPVFLVPPHLSSRDPSYFVLAGLVFTVASEPYLMSEYGPEFMSLAPVALLNQCVHGRMTSRDEQLVILSQVLACKATIGYEDVSNVIVRRFNGNEVRTLKQVVRLVQECTDPAYIFECENDEFVVLDAKEAQDEVDDVLTKNSIPRQCSTDLDSM